MAWVLPVLISIPEHSNPHGNEAHDKIHNTQWGFVSFSFTICAYLQREYLLIHTLLWIEKWWNSIKQHHLICKHVHIFKREVVKADHELSQSSEWVSTHTNNWTGVWLGATAKYISTHCIQLISLVLCALHSSVSFYLSFLFFPSWFCSLNLSYDPFTWKSRCILFFLHLEKDRKERKGDGERGFCQNPDDLIEVHPHSFELMVSIVMKRQQKMNGRKGRSKRGGGEGKVTKEALIVTISREEVGLSQRSRLMRQRKWTVQRNIYVNWQTHGDNIQEFLNTRYVY